MESDTIATGPLGNIEISFSCDGVSISVKSAVQGGSRLLDSIQDVSFTPDLKWSVAPFDAGLLQVV